MSKENEVTHVDDAIILEALAAARSQGKRKGKQIALWLMILVAVCASIWGFFVGSARDKVVKFQLDAVVMEGDCYFDDIEDTLPCYFMKK